MTEDSQQMPQYGVCVAEDEAIKRGTNLVELSDHFMSNTADHLAIRVSYTVTT